MQNRKLGPYLAAIDGILISAMTDEGLMRWAWSDVDRRLLTAENGKLMNFEWETGKLVKMGN
jgi:hypothetical protein